jgi:hypothetical protein
VTNHALHWTANWYAYILYSRFCTHIFQEETPRSKEQDVGRRFICFAHG